MTAPVIGYRLYAGTLRICLYILDAKVSIKYIWQMGIQLTLQIYFTDLRRYINIGGLPMTEGP